MILLIDKPTGITSFDVIRRLRKKLGIRKMGHSGTLDPAASGLLIVATEQDTKKLTELIGLPKQYEVEVLLGVQTDTGDLDGKIIAEKDVSDIAKEDIEKVVSRFSGVHEIPVPVYSAIKQGGQPLYKKARRGEKVEVPIKKMEVLDIHLQSTDLPRVKLVLDVSSGTYVRSLAEEMGHRLGVPATVSGLRRTKIGDYSVESAEMI